MRLLCDAMSGNEEIRKKLIDRYAQFQTLISQKISERTSFVEPDYLAWLILLATDGLLIQKMLGNDAVDEQRLIRMSELYLRSIKPESGDNS